MELHLFPPPDWKLPSVDPLTIQMLAYCRFSGAPLKLVHTTSLFPNSLPRLIHGDYVSHSTLSQLIHHLKLQDYNANHALKSGQLADITAYDKLMGKTLAPAWLYSCWLDKRNYEEVIRPWYAQQFTFPFNWIALRVYESHFRNHIETLCGNKLISLDSPNGQLEIESFLIADAKETINSLSTRLGDKEFFFGSSPTSLDAIAFGYLAPFLNIPLLNNPIKEHLQLKCPNLVKFVAMISSLYFPINQEAKNKKKSKTKDSDKNESTGNAAEEDADWPNQQRDAIISVAVTTTAMVSYAFLIGLVKIEDVRKGLATLTGGLVFASAFASSPRSIQSKMEDEGQDEPDEEDYPLPDPILGLFFMDEENNHDENENPDGEKDNKHE